MHVGSERQSYRISVKTHKQISKLYFPKLKFGKISKRIIELLAMQNQTRKNIYDHMGSFFGITEDYTRHFIWQLKSKGFITEYQNNLELTSFGKFAFLICKYDINFIQLCFLLEAYYCQNRMLENGCKAGFYVTPHFMDKIEDVFTYKYVVWNVSKLIKKGLIYRHHKSALAVMPTIFNELTKYYETVTSFHDWFIETWRKKRELMLNDPFVIRRKREYAALYQKIL
ncbi:MAG TPA: hypothetical protein VD689_03935 [Nitrosopumilaceae archaeon]|nr:hypothetical protein [Nitrosopumilaceae archaeon]